MTAALYMLCALTWSAADAPVDPASARIGGGVFGLLPAATLRADAPAGPLTLAVRYDTAGGLVHDVGLAARAGLGDWRLELEVAHGFPGLEEIGGIQLDDMPLGHGLTTAFVALRDLRTERGHHIRLGAGLTARWTAIRADFGIQERAFDPSLHHMHGEVRIDWTNGVFLRARAVVPIEAELKVLGFWPQVLVGHAWSL